MDMRGNTQQLSSMQHVTKGITQIMHAIPSQHHAGQNVPPFNLSLQPDIQRITCSLYVTTQLHSTALLCS